MYKIEKNKIIIPNEDMFNAKHILECGQIFRFEYINDKYIVYSGKEKAEIVNNENSVEIITKNPKYFVTFFDLNTNYEQIKNELIKFDNDFLNNAINFGNGIKILKQQPFEMIISFIISANNNIPRIKNSIKKICESLGTKIDDYYAFPSLEQLSGQNEDFFKSVGLGYRANYIVETCKMLTNYDMEKLSKLSTIDLRKELMKLKGVGRKVADCIMLFGFGKLDVFPIDTWTNKVYNDNFYNGEKTREQIANYFVDNFGNLSGYAQQYFYYWKQNDNK